LGNYTELHRRGFVTSTADYNGGPTVIR